MQEIANKLLYEFNDAANLTKSHVLDINAPARINVLKVQNKNLTSNESAPCQKRGRPIGSKDSAHRKRKIKQSCPTNTPEEIPHFTQE